MEMYHRNTLTVTITPALPILAVALSFNQPSPSGWYLIPKTTIRRIVKLNEYGTNVRGDDNIGLKDEYLN